MTRKEALALLEQGVDAWNQWRVENTRDLPELGNTKLEKHDLSGLNLSKLCLDEFSGMDSIFIGADFHQASLFQANLCNADLSKSNLTEAFMPHSIIDEAKLIETNLTKAELGYGRFDYSDFSGACLLEADLFAASLLDANLSGTNLRGANLEGAYLKGANLTGADLTGANLNHSILVDADLTGAVIANCSVYGVSAWNLNLKDTLQNNLVVTPNGENKITVDNIELAQFIFLLLNNEKIRYIIDTITSKVVLIIGRFLPERKIVLDAIRDNLRSRNYSPILFDFEKPVSRDLTETISTLAHMSSFVIADITDAKSIPQELQRIVPDLPSVPVQPLLLASEHEYGMFEHFKRYPWVLKTYLYESKEELLANIKERVIEPAEARTKLLTGK